MTLTDHLEQHLGPVAEGWGDDSDSSVRVVRFSDQPDRGVSTYVTLGLSDATLPMSDDRRVREELLVSAYNRFPRDQLASFLMTFADYVQGQRRALVRGDVVGPAGPMIPSVAASAVYASIPVLFQNGFATFRGPRPPTVIVWLIPMPAREALWVKAQGWDAYEKVLESSDVDFFDLNRKSLRS